MNLDLNVYHALKKDIITLRLPGGEFLSEVRLAQRFKVSRTPVREALRRLNHEGLVEVIPNKGTFVSRVDIATIREIFQIREGLEGIAARIATSHLDQKKLEGIWQALDSPDREKGARAGQKLHKVIFEATENKRLLEIIRILEDQMTRIHFLAKRIPGRDDKSIQEHKEIVRALKAGKGDLAEKAMRRHIRSTMRSVFESLADAYY